MPRVTIHRAFEYRGKFRRSFAFDSASLYGLQSRRTGNIAGQLDDRPIERLDPACHRQCLGAVTGLLAIRMAESPPDRERGRRRPHGHKIALPVTGALRFRRGGVVAIRHGER